MLKHQFILRQHSLLKIRVFFLVLALEGVQVVHELQPLEVEGSRLLVFLQEDLFLIFVELVHDYVFLDQAIQRLHVFTGQRDLEVGLMPFGFLLQLLSQVMQSDDIPLHKVIILHRAQQLNPLLDILREDQSILLEDLFDFRYFEDLLLEGGELGLRLVFIEGGLVLLFGGVGLGGLDGG